MNKNVKTFVKNFSSIVLVNIISLTISLSVVLFVPKILDVEQYGYFQLYLFYSSYVIFGHIGWGDGIYLRYGGTEYAMLNYKVLGSQFWLLCTIEILVSIVVFLQMDLFIENQERFFVLVYVLVAFNLAIPRIFLTLIMQATNLIQEYSRILLIERVFFVILSVFFILSGILNYKILIYSDIIGRFISLVVSIYYCKDITKKFFSNIKQTIQEMNYNIKIGIKLLVANLASMLIIGIGRFFIENAWGIIVFGQVSLALSGVNAIIIIINSVSITLFPVLKRLTKETLVTLYSHISFTLMFLSFFCLLLYYPIAFLLLRWLPDYSASFYYLMILFPLCIFEIKWSMLFNTYLKTLRQEKVILTINCLSVIISLFFIVISVFILKSLYCLLISILITVFIRSILAEFFLSKVIKFKKKINHYLEIGMMMLYIGINEFLSSVYALVLYLIVLMLCLYYYKHQIKEEIRFFTCFLKNKPAK